MNDDKKCFEKKQKKENNIIQILNLNIKSSIRRFFSSLLFSFPSLPTENVRISDRASVCPCVPLDIEVMLRLRSPYSFALVPARISVLYERDVVTLEHDPSKLFSVLRFYVVFLGVVENEIHVLVETDYVTLDSQIDVLKQPYLDAGTILKISEYQVYGLYHNLLYLWRSFERHLSTIFIYSLSR